LIAPLKAADASTFRFLEEESGSPADQTGRMFALNGFFTYFFALPKKLFLLAPWWT
jgi:hypothetical protein